MYVSAFFAATSASNRKSVALMMRKSSSVGAKRLVHSLYGNSGEEDMLQVGGNRGVCIAIFIGVCKGYV